MILSPNWLSRFWIGTVPKASAQVKTTVTNAFNGLRTLRLYLLLALGIYLIVLVRKLFR